ncbi:MAG TPA: hypothetical protein VGL62_06660 [Vicinamibacterales bacterium]|jgi:hypothetical protein
MRLIALGLSCALLLAPRPAAAQAQQYAGSVGLTFLGRTTLNDPDVVASNVHVSFGGSAALLGDRIIGVEGLVQVAPHFFKGGDLQIVKSGRTIAAMGNVVLTTPRRWTEYSLRPYVSGGLGLERASVQDEPRIFAFHVNLGGFDVGGGAIGFLTTNTGLRFDVRYFSTLNRTDRGAIAFGTTHLSYITASVGIVFRR